MSRQRRKKQSILIFDCDLELAENIKLYLEEDIHNIRIVSHIEKVINELNKSTFDFIILGYNSLNQTLLKLIENIHLNSPTTKIILMCTFINVEIENERIILSKVDDYIFKPFNVNLLRQKLLPNYPEKKKLNFA